MSALPQGVLTVSQFTSLVKSLLEEGFPQLVVEGEVSGFKPAFAGASKHLYFNIKDERALLKVVWFGGAGKALGFDLRDGVKVRITGRISVYEPSGGYQLVVSSLVQAGMGDILARLEDTKRRLQAEGLFDPARKRPLPTLPASIALITSSTGAAVQDMLRILRNNGCPAKVTILPALVQGTEAPKQLVARLEQANRWNLGEVIIFGRGGGSFEDLLCFSDEAVVRAVAASRLPVISAVGHEVDTPLCDFAADYRAPTPTAAAELVSSAWAAFTDDVLRCERELIQATRQRLERAHLLLQPFAPAHLEDSFRRLVQPFYQRLDDVKEDLVLAIREKIRDLSHRRQLAERELEARSPLGILERGYALVLNQNGQAVTHASSLQPGAELNILFHQGQATTTVKEIKP